MRFRPRRRGRNVGPTAVLGRVREKEFEEVEEWRHVPGQFGVAEPRRQVVEDDFGVGAGVESGDEGADVEDFEEFGKVVAG